MTNVQEALKMAVDATGMINNCLVYCYSRDDVIQSYKAMLSAAPTGSN